MTHTHTHTHTIYPVTFLRKYCGLPDNSTVMSELTKVVTLCKHFSCLGSCAKYNCRTGTVMFVLQCRKCWAQLASVSASV